MQRKRFYSLFIALICIFCMTVPAFAYGGYNTPTTSTDGNPYLTPTTNYTLPGSGVSAGMPVTTTPSLTTGGSLWGNGGIGLGMPGSGTGIGSGLMPGSGTGGGVVTPLRVEPPNIGGYGGGGSSSGDHFKASYSGGDITISLPRATGTSTTDATSAFGTVFQKYKAIGTVIIGICVITAIICLMTQITRLGAAGSNERMRASALKGIIYSGAVIAAFGSLALVVGIFWNALV